MSEFIDERAQPIELLASMRVGVLPTGEIVIVDGLLDELVQRSPEPPYERCWARLRADGNFGAVLDDRDASYGFSSRAMTRNRDTDRQRNITRTTAMARARALYWVKRLAALAKGDDHE